MSDAPPPILPRDAGRAAIAALRDAALALCPGPVRCDEPCVGCWRAAEVGAANDDAPQPMPPEHIVLHPDFGDGEQMLNMRGWLQRAAEAAGGTFTGGGCGMGEADIDVKLEGHSYNIRIKPILRML